MVFSVIGQWIGVICLLLWGYWLCCKLRLPLGFAPLAGLCLAMVALQLAGSAGLLRPGALLLFVGAALSLAHRKKAELAAFLLRPGVLAFLAGVLVLQIACAIRQPRFQTWDEFSHWGIFFKSVFYEHRFALLQAARSLAHPAYPQGLPALYALFTVFLPVYAERDVFFITALPLLAAGGALFELAAPQHAAGKPGRALRLWHIACGCLAVPLLFRVFTPDTPYTTAYMDAPVGAMLAAGLLLTLLPLPGCAPAELRRRAAAIALVCAATSTVKEIGTVFALCVLGVWVLQCLLGFFAQARRGISVKFAQSALLPALAAAVPFAAVLIEWKIVLAILHRNDDQFSSMGFGYFVQCLQEARSGADPYFYDVWAAYYAKFRTTALLFGASSFKLGMACIAISIVLACGLYHTRHRRAALAPLCMCLYWPCYQGVLFYVYICGMSAYEAMRVASYERYACCFFIGWFAVLLGALYLVLCSLGVRPAVWLSAALSGALAVYGGLGLAALADNTSLPYESWRDEQLANAATITEKIAADGGGRGDAIWVLSADNDAAYQNMWYYQYELSPLLVAIETQSGEDGVDLGYNIEQQNVKYLLLLGVSDDFVQRYAANADDALSHAQSADYAVYAVSLDGGAVRLRVVG